MPDTNNGGLLMAVRSALAEIADPLVENANIVATGRITALSLTADDAVRLVIEAREEPDALFDAMVERAKKTVGAVPGLTRLQVIATRHSTAARQTGAPAQQNTMRPSPAAPPQGAAGGHANPLGLSKQGGPNQGPGKKSAPKPDLKDALSDVGHVIAIASGKGGVGKSTITVNLARALQDAGHRVGILDCDIYGPSLPTLLGIEGKPTMADGKIQPVDAQGIKAMSIGWLVDTDKALAWRGPMVMGAVRQMITDVAWPALDFLLIDTPPGTGDAHLTLAQSGRIDGVVIVTTPQEMALTDVRRGLAFFQRTNVPVIGLIENMAWLELPDGTRQFIFGEGGGKRMADELEIELLGSIALEPSMVSASDQGERFVTTSQSKAAISLREIAGSIAGKTIAPKR